MNQFFDNIYCINLDERTDRWQESQDEFERLNLNVERFSAVLGNASNWTSPLLEGELGIIQSHVKLAEHVLEAGYEKVLILEDDIEFSQSFNQDFALWSQEIPSDWQMLYLGGNLVGWKPDPVSEHVHRGEYIFAIHALGLKKEVLESLLLSVDPAIPIDVWYARASSRFNSYIMVPRMAWQRSSFSDIQGQKVEYTFLRKGQWGIDS